MQAMLLDLLTFSMRQGHEQPMYGLVGIGDRVPFYVLRGTSNVLEAYKGDRILEVEDDADEIERPLLSLVMATR